uniref:Uncharacterized protein n=1 Tax=Cucumis melo TaxID=3656 RepID=A0A9I9EDI4_CUCME
MGPSPIEIENTKGMLKSTWAFLGICSMGNESRKGNYYDFQKARFHFEAWSKVISIESRMLKSGNFIVFGQVAEHHREEGLGVLEVKDQLMSFRRGALSVDFMSSLESRVGDLERVDVGVSFIGCYGIVMLGCYGRLIIELRCGLVRRWCPTMRYDMSNIQNETMGEPDHQTLTTGVFFIPRGAWSL